MIESLNPYTQERMQSYDYMSWETVDQLIQQAHSAFTLWKHISFAERKTYMKNLAQLMQDQFESLALLDTQEMGMLYKDAKGDVTKSASNISYFAEHAEALLAPKPFDQDGLVWEIIYQPKWVIFSVMPWNYPFNQVLRSAIPNIMAGNVVVMKHASNVPQIAEKLEELFLQAGFPRGVYTNLFVPHEFTEKIIAHPLIIGANVTGSDAVGRQIGSLAGKYLKPSILELGGNDPFIVLDNADMDAIVAQAIKGRFSNYGQKCNSSKRFIVLASVYDDFCQKFSTAVQALHIGDPMQASTDIWPLAKASAVATIDHQVQSSIQAWATVLVGGAPAPQFWPNFYLPTVLKDVRPGMKVFDEEVFWPVAPIIKAETIDDAIALANMSVYGLGCSVFGDDMAQKEYVAQRVEVSNVFFNKVVTSYAFLPYGGIKNTWYGKELSEQGLKAFVNEKIVVK